MQDVKPAPQKLSLLAQEIGFVLSKKECGNALVQNVTSDSRQVKTGTVFVACEGVNSDGHDYIQQAVQKGVVAVVGTKEIQLDRVPYIRVADSRAVLAHIAAALYRYPARRMTVIGVTGTDGKTTTTNLIYHILRQAGFRCGMISTVNALIGEQTLDTGFHITTPDAPDIQRILAMMEAEGTTHVVLEATSHGLAQRRVEACEFDVGVVTNITHEHLDFHGSYEAYRAAKAHLFKLVAETQPKSNGIIRRAVINADDCSYPFLRDFIQIPQISYGRASFADVVLEKIVSSIEGLTIYVRGLTLHSTLLGEYNAGNILAAVVVGKDVLELPDETICAGIAALENIPGRMERIELGQPFTAIVDFAHTPNALRNALSAARLYTNGKVVAIFGSAGLRDREKRRLMAEVSAQLADITLLTAEDPRSESLADILADMAEGAKAKGGVEGKTFYCIPDRREAIRFGVRLARKGDMVMACGKGHEQSMCFGTTEYAWDDKTAMRAALAELLGVYGEEMPFLPCR